MRAVPVSDQSKLGKLITDMRLIDEPALQEALRVAKQFQLPLGKALVFAGALDDHELKLVMQVQALMRKYPLSTEESRTAIEATALIIRLGRNAACDSFAMANWTPVKVR